MKNLWNRLENVEPARLYLLLRVAAYVAVGATGAAVAPDDLELILGTLAALLGVDAATTEATRRKVSSPRTAAELIAHAFVGEAGTFVRGLVERSVPQAKWAQGLQASLPILTEFAGAQLTPDVRGEIQKRVDAALLNAGLVKRRTGGPLPVSLLVLLVLLVLVPTLGACSLLAPVGQEVGGETVDYVLGDVATLTLDDAGLTFDPVDGSTAGVVVNIVAVEIHGEHPHCEPYELEGLVGRECHLATVDEPALLPFGIVDGYASATYTRLGSSRPYRIGLD